MDNKVKVDRFTNGDGEQVERMAFTVRGHNVQVMRYDGNDEAMLAKVDQRVAQLPKKRVVGWVLNHLLEK